MNLKYRVIQLEKEVADLKQQLENQPVELEKITQKKIEKIFKGMTFAKLHSLILEK